MCVLARVRERECVCVRACAKYTGCFRNMGIFKLSVSFATCYVSYFLVGHYKARTYALCPKFSKRHSELQLRFKFQILIDAILLQNFTDMECFQVDLVYSVSCAHGNETYDS